MSKKLKVIVGILIIVVIVGIVWMVESALSGPTPVSPSAEQATANNSYTAVTGTSPSDNSDAALQQDAASIDAQMGALNSDSANADAGISAINSPSNQ